MITIMEQRFYEHTMPEILRTLKAINESLAKINETLAETRGKEQEKED